jgi:hypothetical protein
VAAEGIAVAAAAAATAAMAAVQAIEERRGAVGIGVTVREATEEEEQQLRAVVNARISLW